MPRPLVSQDWQNRKLLLDLFHVPENSDYFLIAASVVKSIKRADWLSQVQKRYGLDWVL